MLLLYKRPRNIGTDGHSLELFDFGTAMYITDDGFDVMKSGEYNALATCIHFILSGVGPFGSVKSMEELRKLQRDLVEGGGEVHPDAGILRRLSRIAGPDGIQPQLSQPSPRR